MSHHPLPLQRCTYSVFSIALCLCSSFGRCMSVCVTCVGASLEASSSLFLALLPSLPLLLRPIFSLCCFPLVRSRSFTVLPHNSHLVAQSICALSLTSLSISPFSPLYFLSLSFSLTLDSVMQTGCFHNSLYAACFNMINIVAAVVHVHGMMNC